MKKLLLIPLCLILIISPLATFAVHATESIDWECGDDNLYSFVASDATIPQLTGYLYWTNMSSNELVYFPDLLGFYNLHLAIGVIGDEPAENVQVQIDINDTNPTYHNSIVIQATISADNYETVSVSQRVSFYNEDNCEFGLLSKPVQFVQDRTNFENGTILDVNEPDDGPIFISGINDSISPGSENICEIIIPCIFSSDPPVFTETNQPPQTRFNAITDNPVIGNEKTNSAWITDEAGNFVNSLEAGHTYTAHFYVRVSGPDPATNVCIQSYTVDGLKINDGQSWRMRAYVKADEARSVDIESSYTARGKLEFQYVDGSLLLCRNGQEDVALNPVTFFRDSFTSGYGIKIGTAGLDGVINPGLESACEITYQFSTVDLDAKEEAERAIEEAEDAKKTEEKKAEEEALRFSDNCEAWLTNKGGYEANSLKTGETYTVHLSVRVDGVGQAEGVRISSSDLSALAFDSSSRNFYLKLMAENIEDSTVSIAAQRARNVDDVLTFEYVKGSLQAKSAAGVYMLSDKEFFNYGAGCLVGFGGTDGLIPAGKDNVVEITYQVKAVAQGSKFKLEASGLWRSPVFAVILLIIAVLELICIIWMSHHPDNWLSRRVERSRRYWKTVKAGFATARADLRGENSSAAQSSKVASEQDEAEPNDKHA